MPIDKNIEIFAAFPPFRITIAPNELSFIALQRDDNMVNSLKDLQALARMNLNERGYRVYKHLLEPTIESMLKNYLKPWQDIESNVFALCVHTAGANKSDMDFILEIGRDDIKLGDMIDAEKYFELPFRFKERINYLHDKRVIGDNLYRLLIALNQRRNGIHSLGGYITDEERQIHEQVASALQWIMIFIRDPGSSEDFKTATLKSIETSAANIFGELKAES